MAGSGHIAGVVNPPASNKYQYWTGGTPTGDFNQWIASATEAPGSWWPHWHDWIKAEDDRMVPARKTGGTMNSMRGCSRQLCEGACVTDCNVW